MTRLTIWADADPARPERVTTEPAAIARLLERFGVRFEIWPLRESLPAEADQDAVLAAYAEEIARLGRETRHQSADVVRIARGTAGTGPLREKFLAEHTHADDEIRFFVEGAGAFYLHVDGRVCQLVCESGDLLGVPAGTRHWFDMGEFPHFTAIRLFTTPEGWIADFTGDMIAGRFPLFETAP